MKNICTVSDSNYLLKGLTLFESLIEKTTDLTLHYLCIDDLSFNNLKKYESESLLVYNVADLVNQDKKLKELKNKDYRYFCWSLASYFQNYLMVRLNSPLTYIDSDIYFHQSFDEILNAIGQNDVGIFRHRQFPLNSNRPEGLYNVGVVYFNNSELSKYILDWWSDAVLHMKYPELATCGDQKYLEAFPKMCPKDRLFIDGDIGHGAPWQWQLFDFSDYENDGTIMWENKKQTLVFSHFSQFVHDFDNDRYVPSTQHHIYTPLTSYQNISGLKKIYDEYFEKLKSIRNKYHGC